MHTNCDRLHRSVSNPEEPYGIKFKNNISNWMCVYVVHSPKCRSLTFCVNFRIRNRSGAFQISKRVSESAYISHF